MTQEEIEHFNHEGLNRLTAINFSIRQLDDWAEAYTQRGGSATFGTDAAAIAALIARIKSVLVVADRNLVARLRTDI